MQLPVIECRVSRSLEKDSNHRRVPDKRLRDSISISSVSQRIITDIVTCLSVCHRFEHFRASLKSSKQRTATWHCVSISNYPSNNRESDASDFSLSEFKVSTTHDFEAGNLPQIYLHIYKPLSIIPHHQFQFDLSEKYRNHSPLFVRFFLLLLKEEGLLHPTWLLFCQPLVPS